MKKRKTLILVLIIILIVILFVILRVMSIESRDQKFIKAASNAVTATKVAEVKEAMSLARSEILKDYSKGIKTSVTAKEVKDIVESYLDNITVNVTKDPNQYVFIVSVDGLDLGEDNKIDLTEMKENKKSK